MRKLQIVWPSKNYWLVMLGILSVSFIVFSLLGMSTNKTLIQITESQQEIIKQYETLLGGTPDKVGEGYARDTY